MSNLDDQYGCVLLIFTITLILVPFVVVIAGFSGCDIRKRAEKQACRHGSAAQCLALGKYYEGKAMGIIGFAMSNGATATDYYELGCKHGSLVSCERLGHIVLKRYDSVKDSSVSDEEGLRALARACVGDVSGACDEMNKAYDDYLDGSTAQDIASKFFLHACLRRRQGAGCYRFADFMESNHDGVTADPALAKKYFAKACADGYRAGCARAK